MKKILVIGGSHSDVPIIKAAVAYGLQVITTGNRPDHPGHVWAHKYIEGDYSKPDQMLNIARHEQVQAVVPGANDFAMIAASYVAQELGLGGFDSYETTLAVHEKDKFKAIANRIGLPICEYQVVDTSGIEGLRIQPPCIVKPVDLTGGKGISRMDSKAELTQALKMARQLSRKSNVIVEEYFSGDLHSYSTVIVEGKVVFEYVDNEYCLFNPYLVSTSDNAAKLPSCIISKLKQATEALAVEMQLVNGVLHCQFMFNQRDIRILEYTRRPSGDLYGTVVQMATGVAHNQIFIESALGTLDTSLSGLAIGKSPRRSVSRHCITATHSGNLKALNISKEIRPYLVDLVQIAKFGDSVNHLAAEKVAVAVLVYPDDKTMAEFTKNINSYLGSEVGPNDSI
jgi:biotin carboxylase